MAIRFIVGLLFLMASLVGQAQERVIDLKDVYTVVDLWTEALNQKDLTTLSGLYADEVIFYAKKLPKASCLGIKRKRLRSSRYFHQEIPKKPLVKVYDSGIIRASFVKEITSGEEVKSYDAYLLLKTIDGELRIVGESDLIADGEANFVPDVGKELKISLLSESRLRVGAPVEDGEEQWLLNEDLVTWLGAGALLGVIYFIFRWVRKGRSGDKKLMLGDLKRHDDPIKAQKALDDGYAFEQFIVSRFNQQYFKLQDWTPDKTSSGVYAKSSMNPDLHFEFRFQNYVKHFAVECKYRKSLFNGKFELKPGQVKNYRRYSQEKNIPVYIVLGVGGVPKAPNELFVLPLDLFSTTSVIGYPTIRNYYNNPEKNFYLETKTGNLTWFRKPGE